MWSYIINRLFQMLVTLLVLSTLIFFLFRILPGDPLSMFIDAALPVEAQEAVMKQFGLDKPLWQQYVTYMSNLFRGEFGVSFHYRQPVIEIIGEKVWSTAILMGAALLIAFAVGVLGGAVMAWIRGSKIEILGTALALFFRSAPVFWTGMVVLLIFSYRLGWFPAGGMRSVGTEVLSNWDKFVSLDFLHHLVLPALTAALYYIATPLLVMRTAMIEVMNDDFIEMARAKGLSEWKVLTRHAMRNSLLPVVTVLCLMVGFAIGGQVLVETVFRWPGLGREMVAAIQRNDYPVAQATFFLMGILVIFLNLVADLLYGILDPRVTYD